MKTAANRYTIIIAYFLIYVVWGSTYYFIGVALKGLPTFLLGGQRHRAALCRYGGYHVGAAVCQQQCGGDRGLLHGDLDHVAGRADVEAELPSAGDRRGDPLGVCRCRDALRGAAGHGEPCRPAWRVRHPDPDGRLRLVVARLALRQIPLVGGRGGQRLRGVGLADAFREPDVLALCRAVWRVGRGGLPVGPALGLVVVALPDHVRLAAGLFRLCLAAEGAPGD